MQHINRPTIHHFRAATLADFAKRHSFTERETDVFVLLAGRTVNSTELGKKLGVSHHTVSNHLKNIFQKTKVGNKAELLALFICDFLTLHSREDFHASVPDNVTQTSEAV